MNYYLLFCACIPCFLIANIVPITYVLSQFSISLNMDSLVFMYNLTLLSYEKILGIAAGTTLVLSIFSRTHAIKA